MNGLQFWLMLLVPAAFCVWVLWAPTPPSERPERDHDDWGWDDE